MYKAAHFLDPLDGYRSMQEEDDLRVNYRRVELGAILVVLIALVQAAGNVVHGVGLLWALIGIALSGAFLFWCVARRAQQGPSLRLPRLAENFAIFCTLCSSCAGWIAGLEGYVTSGYSLAILCCALFLMIPARRFMVIAIVTYAFFVAWSMFLPVPFFSKMYSITNTGFSVLVSCFGRIGIERIQHIGRMQRIHIAEQNETLKTRNDELNDLMAVTAHDLRSPLFGLRNVLEMARADRTVNWESLDRVLDAAGQSVTAMLALVSRLLDVHEVEARAAPLLRHINLNAKVAACARRMDLLARGGMVDMLIVAPDDPVFVLSDSDGIARMLDNLISNAIRYSPAGSIIEARIATGPDGSSIDIIDSGVGIAEADHAILFAKFSRGSRSPTNGTRGSGLGLYIVAVLAKQVGATCDYRPNPSGGSIFRLSFPANPEP